MVHRYFNTDDGILNALVMQYLLALGDFAFADAFVATSPNGNLVWVLFALATFLTQVTILNMMIAIMGDAFARVTEIKEQSGLKEKISILADYVWIIPNEKL